MTTRSLFLLPGDGIGVETMAEVRKIIAWMNEAKGAGFVTDEGLVGGSAYDAHGSSISDADMEKAMASDAVLFGVLKKGGFLTRDSRVVERKKYGRAKARRSFQFSKR